MEWALDITGSRGSNDVIKAVFLPLSSAYILQFHSGFLKSQMVMLPAQQIQKREKPFPIALTKNHEGDSDVPLGYLHITETRNDTQEVGNSGWPHLATCALL